MWARHLQRLLNVHRRAEPVRLDFAGTNVCSNLKLLIDSSRDRCFTSLKSLNPVCSGRKLLVHIEKGDQILSRLRYTEIDDGITEYVSENEYAHSLLSKRGVKSIAASFGSIDNVTDKEAEKILNTNWKNSSPEEILEAFERLSFHAKLNSISLDEEKHEEILNALICKLGQLDTDKLFRLFACLRLWQGIWWTKCPVYVSLWKELDCECINRLANWSTDEALVACDYWYHLRLSRVVKFSMMVLKKLGNKPKQLTADNFLTFMFMINVCRNPPVNMYEIEYKFDTIFSEFTADELGIIAMGFFKSQTPFRDENILSKIHLKMLQNMASMQDISISAVMKITRYSKSLKALNTLRKVLHALPSRIEDLTIPCLSNIVHAAAFVQCFEPKVMSLIVKKFEKNIDQARLKDLERFSWVLSMFDYNPEEQVYEKIVASLRDPKRRTEMQTFPKLTPTALSHLSFARIFPIDLIKKHFDSSFLRQTYDMNPYKIGYNYLTLECNIRIDLPEYEGPFLQPSVRDYLAKKFLWFQFQSGGKIHPSDKLIVEVAHVCKLVFKSETSICINQVLPHYVKPDIIICLDENNNPIDPQPILSKLTDGTIKYSPQMEQNCKWIAIALATQNQMISGTDELVGPFKCKIRQLEKIGYSPVVIRMTEWRSLSNFDAMQEYLRKRLSLPTDENVSTAVL